MRRLLADEQLPINLAQPPVAQPEKGRMMEVGSSAGYYTSKSPQMILHEWCRRQNRPKPRYKVLPGEDGQFRCKVRACGVTDNFIILIHHSEPCLMHRHSFATCC
jgi:dsRNA-specific ribonuclease